VTILTAYDALASVLVVIEPGLSAISYVSAPLSISTEYLIFNAQS